METRIQGPKEGRIPMLERHQVVPEIAALYDTFQAQRGIVPYMFKTVAHTPGLALGIAGFLKPLRAVIKSTARTVAAKHWRLLRTTSRN